MGLASANLPQTSVSARLMPPSTPPRPGDRKAGEVHRLVARTEYVWYMMPGNRGYKIVHLVGISNPRAQTWNMARTERTYSAWSVSGSLQRNST